MVKAVFFDVDGTLLSHTKKAVSESTRTALDALAQKGVHCVVATGRHMCELEQLPLDGLRFDGYISLNGQLSLDARGEVLSSAPITGEDKEYLLRIFRNNVIPLVLVEKDRMYINFINEQVKSAQEAISTPLPEIGEYTGNELYMAVAYLDKAQQQELDGLLSNCRITRWNPNAIDIIASGGGKQEGIRQYLERNHILLEETMAFGDGENDVDMLRYVGIGIAMGNAEAVTKENADYITASVDDDGIYNALVTFKVIDSEA